MSAINFGLNLPVPKGFKIDELDFLGKDHTYGAEGERIERTPSPDRIRIDKLIEESTGKRFVRCNDIRCEGNTNPQEDKAFAPTGGGFNILEPPRIGGQTPKQIPKISQPRRRFRPRERIQAIRKARKFKAKRSLQKTFQKSQRELAAERSKARKIAAQKRKSTAATARRTLRKRRRN